MAGCQSCNSCESCYSCQGTCDTCQSFCQLDKQTVGSFIFRDDNGVRWPIGKDKPFLSKNSWNRLISYINSAYAKGTEYNGGSSGLPVSDSNTFITAEMFNKVINAFGGLGGIKSNNTITEGVKPNFFNPDTQKFQNSVTKDVDIVYGSYFTTLENFSTNWQYKKTQSDSKCNTGCNVTCQGNSCQAHTPTSCVSTPS